MMTWSLQGGAGSAFHVDGLHARQHHSGLLQSSSSQHCRMSSPRRLRYADVKHFNFRCSIDTDQLKIGINLGDPVFRGVYHGKPAHDEDLRDVIQRALEVGCEKMMVTGSDLKESAHAIKLTEEFRMSSLPFPRLHAKMENSGHLLRHGWCASLLVRTVRQAPPRT